MSECVVTKGQEYLEELGSTHTQLCDPFHSLRLLHDVPVPYKMADDKAGNLAGNVKSRKQCFVLSRVLVLAAILIQCMCFANFLS